MTCVTSKPVKKLHWENALVIASKIHAGPKQSPSNEADIYREQTLARRRCNKEMSSEAKQYGGRASKSHKWREEIPSWHAFMVRCCDSNHLQFGSTMCDGFQFMFKGLGNVKTNQQTSTNINKHQQNQQTSTNINKPIKRTINLWHLTQMWGLACLSWNQAWTNMMASDANLTDKPLSQPQQMYPKGARSLSFRCGDIHLTSGFVPRKWTERWTSKFSSRTHDAVVYSPHYCHGPSHHKKRAVLRCFMSSHAIYGEWVDKR